MANWTLSTATCFRPYGTAFGPPRLKYFQESSAASTAVIQRGQVITNNTVVSSASHTILRAPSSGGNGGNLLQVAITSLLGVAMEGSTSDGSTTNLTNKKIGVFVADANTEFIGWLKGTGPADSTLIGLQKAVIFDSTLKTHFIDSTNSTAALVAVTITGVPDWALGDTNGPVLFKFLSSNVAPII